MRVVPAGDAVVGTYGGETRRQYYAPQLRLGITVLPPDRTQTFHSHATMFESILVLSGKVQAHEKEGGDVHVVELSEGDFVTFDPGPVHALRNSSDEPATIVAVST